VYINLSEPINLASSKASSNRCSSGSDNFFDSHDDLVSYIQLEDMRKHCKTHRNIMELDSKYLEEMLTSDMRPTPKVGKRNNIGYKDI